MTGDDGNVSLGAFDDEQVSPIERFPGVATALGAAEFNDVPGGDDGRAACAGVNGGDLLAFARLVVMAIEILNGIVARANG
jgi:hypothetical protein